MRPEGERMQKDMEQRIIWNCSEGSKPGNLQKLQRKEKNMYISILVPPLLHSIRKENGKGLCITIGDGVSKTFLWSILVLMTQSVNSNLYIFRQGTIFGWQMAHKRGPGRSLSPFWWRANVYRWILSPSNAWKGFNGVSII